MRSVIGVILLTWIVSRAPAADWPQWRGPNRDGVWEEKGLPEKFPAQTLEPRWRKPIGGGYSGIAVVAGRVYTLDYQKKPNERERVLCLNAANGETVWSHPYEVRYEKMDYGNGPRSTPTVHDGRVYTYGARGHLHCLDAAKGKVVWSRDLIKDFNGRIPTWGHACSPLIDGDRVIVQPGGEGTCLVALDRRTGKEVWRSLSDRPGYASPVVLAGKGWRQIAYFLPEHTVGLDPENGKELWRVAHEKPINYDVSISDVVFHDGVLLAGDYWIGSRAIQFDDKGLNPTVAWKGKHLHLLMSTPLVRDGHAYALDKKDGLKCVELKTGAVKWEGKHIVPRGRNPQAVLVWVGERALIFNEKCELIWAKLTPEKFEELARAQVPLKNNFTWANPAFADRCVFVRNDEEILCVPLTK